MLLQRQSDEELMLGVKQGRQYLLGELFERHHLKLYNFFLKFCGNRYWSEDMVQNTYLRILKYASSYHANGKFQAWMFNIARNAALDYLHRENVSSQDTDLDMDSFEAAVSDPEYIEEMKQGERKLQLALLRLSAENRQLVLLSKINQISISNLAEMYECNQGAVKVRIHRALEQLRKYCEI